MARDRLLYLVLAVCFPVLEVCALRPAGGVSGERRIELGCSRVRVGLLHASIPLVNVYVNGRGPYPFLVDTAANGHGRVDRALAQGLCLPVVGRSLAGDGTGRGRRFTDVVAVDHMCLGAATFRDLRLAVGDYRGHAFAGILGFGLFDGLLLTLDGPRRTLELAAGSLSPATGSDVLDLALDQGVPLAPIRLGRKATLALLDTGADAGLILPLGELGRAPLAIPPSPGGRGRTSHNSFEVQHAALRRPLVIGDRRIESPAASFTAAFPRPVLGHGILCRLRLTLDVRNGRLRVE